MKKSRLAALSSGSRNLKDGIANTSDRARTAPKYCPQCSALGLIYDTRNRDGYVWRRHVCKKNHAWTSIEVMVEGTASGASAHSQALKAMKAEAIGQLIEVLQRELA